MMLSHITRTLLLFATLSILTGCSSNLSMRGDYIHAYRQGKIEKAEEILDQTIEIAIPHQDICESKDAVWLLLDRGTTHFVEGNLDEAIADFKSAIEAIDYYSQDCPSESLGKFLLQDDWGAYPGEHFEQILSRIYFALVLLQDGDQNNALALLKQAEEVQQKKKEIYRKDKLTKDFHLVENPLAKYLMAALLEQRGDHSNARILYKQASESSENLLWNETKPLDNDAVLIFLAHNGNAPLKVSGVSDASIVSAAALEVILACHQIDPAWSSLTGIPIPVLTHQERDLPTPVAVTVNSQYKVLQPIFDVTATAYQQLQQNIPMIAARGAARMLIRRGTVAYFQKQDPSLGTLADIAMLIANSNTQADTRQWSILPSQIDIARFNLAPNIYSICIHNPPPFQQNFQIYLNAHDLCIINIFNINPGCTIVRIPKQFLINQGEYQ